MTMSCCCFMIAGCCSMSCLELLGIDKFFNDKLDNNEVLFDELLELLNNDLEDNLDDDLDNDLDNDLNDDLDDDLDNDRVDGRHYARG